MNAVSPHKDVEGLHAVNLGYLQQYQRTLYPPHVAQADVPCTAKAVGKLLDYSQVPVKGRTVLLFNNSLILAGRSARTSRTSARPSCGRSTRPRSTTNSTRSPGRTSS